MRVVTWGSLLQNSSHPLALHQILLDLNEICSQIDDVTVGVSVRVIVGLISNMAGKRINAFKNINHDGSILEVVIWKAPKPVSPTDHGYKYRAVYVVGGLRLVGFDNERGNGDRCHIGGKESLYVFTSVDQFLEDFIAAVEIRSAS